MIPAFSLLLPFQAHVGVKPNRLLSFTCATAAAPLGQSRAFDCFVTRMRTGCNPVNPWLHPRRLLFAKPPPPRPQLGIAPRGEAQSHVAAPVALGLEPCPRSCPHSDSDSDGGATSPADGPVEDVGETVDGASAAGTAGDDDVALLAEPPAGTQLKGDSEDRETEGGSSEDTGPAPAPAAGLALGRSFASDELKINRGQVLGMGAFSTVFRGSITKDPECGRKVVVKTVFFGPVAARQAEVELHANSKLMGCNIQNIARFVGYHRWKERFWLIWDFQGERTLDSILSSAGWLDTLETKLLRLKVRRAPMDTSDRIEAVMRRVLSQLLSALNAIHAQRVVHRDIKPQNLVIGDDGELRLVDFGCALDLDSDFGYIPKEYPGSKAYAPPEMKLDRSRPWAFDVYSVAIVALQVLFEGLRGEGTLEEMRAKSLDQWLEDHLHRSSDAGSTRQGVLVLEKDEGALWDLIRLMTDESPARRPPASELLQHRFFHSKAEPIQAS